METTEPTNTNLLESEIDPEEIIARLNEISRQLETLNEKQSKSE